MGYKPEVFQFVILGGKLLGAIIPCRVSQGILVLDEQSRQCAIQKTPMTEKLKDHVTMPGLGRLGPTLEPGLGGLTGTCT